LATTYVLPYRALVAGDPLRLYLAMNVTGINGQSGAVMGLVDSGADGTAFPLGYASLMGYSAATLSQQTCVGVGGAATTYVATVPCSMFVIGNPAVVIPIQPSFVPSSQFVLWGRRDFMACYDVAILEKQQQFTITPS
jgi:hypothetical protein